MKKKKKQVNERQRQNTTYFNGKQTKDVKKNVRGFTKSGLQILVVEAKKIMRDNIKVHPKSIL